MNIRSATSADYQAIDDIDGTIESARYLHVDQTGEGMNRSWKLDARDLREKLIQANRLDVEARFTLRQIVSGADEGIALVADHDNLPVALAMAQPDPESGLMAIIDVRVDSDHRRLGLGSALIFRMMHEAREQQCRAVYASVAANNFPANQLLERLNFELTGLDTHRRSNHDLVKETVTMLWYAPLQ